MQFRGTGTVRDSSVEERLEILQSEIHSTRDIVQRNSERQEKGLREVEDLLKNETEARASAVANSELRVEQLAVGGLKYEVVGLIWLVAGTLTSNLPDEVAKLIEPIG